MLKEQELAIVVGIDIPGTHAFSIAESLEELKRKLRKKVMDQTIRLILAYLEDRGSILIGPKGISWIENKDSKFLKFIQKSKVIEI